MKVIPETRHRVIKFDNLLFYIIVESLQYTAKPV
jgi:hypothetical protein